MRIVTPRRLLAVIVAALLSLGLVAGLARADVPQATVAPARALVQIGDTSSWPVSCGGSKLVKTKKLTRKGKVPKGAKKARLELKRVKGEVNHYKIRVNTKTKKKYPVTLRIYAQSPQGDVGLLAQYNGKATKTPCYGGKPPRGGKLVVVATMKVGDKTYTARLERTYKKE